MNITSTNASGASSQPPTVTLDLVIGLCGNGECPTVYRTDRGTFVIQGDAFEPAEAGVTVSDGERMVEIPAELVSKFARTLA